ncbi:MAG: YraN family protein [Armatimonadota bacterium]
MRSESEHRAWLGRLGENAAAEELERRGYRILTRNYHCRGGEADLVAEEGEALVFVEVKARATLRHGLPQEAVGWTKQQRLGRAAVHYLHAHRETPGLEDRPVRFDVVEVVVLNGDVATVEVIRDAFVPEL